MGTNGECRSLSQGFKSILPINRQNITICQTKIGLKYIQWIRNFHGDIILMVQDERVMSTTLV